MIDEEYFWSKFQKLYGDIQPHLKIILKKQNLMSKSLARLNRESIARIAADMKNRAARLAKAGLQDDPLAYGDFAADPHNFEFYEGEILCLLDIASIVDSKGIDYFIRLAKKATAPPPQKASVHQPQNANQTSFTTDPEELKAKLNEKVLLELLKWNYHEIALQSSQIEMIMLSDGFAKQKAKIFCPLCNAAGKRQSVSLSADTSENWHLFNLKRHCKNFHCDKPEADIGVTPPKVVCRDIEMYSSLSSSSALQAEHAQREIQLNDAVADESFDFDELIEDESDLQENEEELPAFEEQGSCSTIMLGSKRKQIDSDIPLTNTRATSEEKSKDKPLFRIQKSVESKHSQHKPRGVRYSETELDVASYEFLTGGKSNYKVRKENISTDKQTGHSSSNSSTT